MELKSSMKNNQMKRRKKFRLKLEQAPPKMEDNKPQVHDPMEEVNLDIVEEPRIIYISSLLSTNLKKQIISLL